MKLPTVLIVDDAPSVRQLLQTVFSRAGYATVEAASGASAVRLASRHHPDLIVLDVELPIMNGFKVCERLKAASGVQDTKVLMLTARAADEDRDRAHELGADAFVTKPFHPAPLLELAARLLAPTPA